jgi:site-specific DNA-cytosine methylase
VAFTRLSDILPQWARGDKGDEAMNDILRQVHERMQAGGLSLKAAANQIGVTVQSLQRHLAGAYVRSDSLARYRAWLVGRTATPQPTTSSSDPGPPPIEDDPLTRLQLAGPSASNQHPYNVVDLFSGCGGMSLGFDLFGKGAESREEIFRTVLALDIEQKVVQLQNQNHPASPTLAGMPARWVDVSSFLNEAEILTFYLDHYVRRCSDEALDQALGELPRFPLAEFKTLIHRLDASFLATIHQLRLAAPFRKIYGQVDSTVFGQTSVIGFHAALGLPLTGTGLAILGPLVWANHPIDPGNCPGNCPDLENARRRMVPRLEERWAEEVARLQERTAGRGKGQLASSAGRIQRFLAFLASGPMEEVRVAWIAWRSARDALRGLMFDAPTEKVLRTLYQGPRRVEVLLGGPPCQGFSRIGRGKIRSLREDHVHVGTDPEAGDVRNRLLLKYVQFVSALEPRVFLFENVRHFQASVQTPEGTFLASEILHDAIQELSGERLDYRVKDCIVNCAHHLVPQTRERFVMVGVRADVSTAGLDPNFLPEWCLALPSHDPVPLRAALQGLPAPLLARGQRSSADAGLSGKVTVRATPATGAAAEFVAWITQVPPVCYTARFQGGIDGHSIREPRADDQTFFELLGPGRRWMDYRCDDSPTLRQLAELVARLREVAKAGSGLERNLLDELAGKLDGSLSLRLLLEGIRPQVGELHHHLITPNYLAKREGNNGDWIARLHPDRPCKTIVSHMAKDTYAYVHPSEPRTLSVREAARVQTFPDWFTFGTLGLVDGFRAVGNAVPPLLSFQFARKIAQLLRADDAARAAARMPTAS